VCSPTAPPGPGNTVPGTTEAAVPQGLNAPLSVGGGPFGSSGNEGNVAAGEPGQSNTTSGVGVVKSWDLSTFFMMSLWIFIIVL
jgi:hypothetical protein